jgi:hypothetical protein
VENFKNLLRRKTFILVSRIIIAEIIIGTSISVFTFFFDFEEGYNAGSFGELVSFDVFSIALIVILQTIVILLIYARWHKSYMRARKLKRFSLRRLIRSGENNKIEFKETFRWDTREKQINKNLEKVVMKEIVGFLNSQGGRLVIGVTDSGQVIGLENDYKTLTRGNKDGFENHLNHVIKSMIGVEFNEFLNISFEFQKEKEVCLIKVKASTKPVFLRANGQEEFYIRTGNATTPLTMSQAVDYISEHWQK